MAGVVTAAGKIDPAAIADGGGEMLTLATA